MTLRRMGMDFDQRQLLVEFSDGETRHEPMPARMLRDDAGLRRVLFDFTRHELEVTLPHGEIVTVDIGSGGDHDLPPAGVPIVYLDQLHWVTLARQLWAPAKVLERDRSAAVTLIEWARERRILLPLSGAHLVEMGPTDGRHRQHLASVLLGLSRGWQMRNPYRVRSEELEASISGRPLRAERVFTLEPNVLFTGELPEIEIPSDFPDPWGELYRRLTAVSAVYATVVDDEKLDMSAGHAKAEGWAAEHQALADYMRRSGKSREDARIIARARLLADYRPEIAESARLAGAGQERFERWLKEMSDNGLGDMPYLGRIEEIYFHRLRNADDKWNRNDLFDIEFLACAAGYADVVVGEKKTSEYLNRAQDQVADGAFVCRTLPEAVTYLEDSFSARSERPAA